MEKIKKNNIDEYLSMLDFQSGQPYESTQQIWKDSELHLI